MQIGHLLPKLSSEYKALENVLHVQTKSYESVQLRFGEAEISSASVAESTPLIIGGEGMVRFHRL